MPKKISVVGRSHLIAAVAAAALLCLAAVPAEAGCSKRVTLYNASWCPYCKQGVYIPSAPEQIEILEFAPDSWSERILGPW